MPLGSSCSSWNGGKLDISSSSSSWIWATKSGSAINSDDIKVSISQHDTSGGFTFDLTKATGGSSDNPFLDSSTPDPSTSGSAASPSSTSGNGNYGWGPFGPWGGPYGGPGSNNPYSGNPGSSGNSGNSGSSAVVGTTPQKLQSVRTAHCVIMSLTFLVLLPLGAILMRVLSFPSLVYIHAIAQLFSLTLALAGFALGVWYIRTTKQPFSSEPHFILGTTVISMLLLQPFFGFLHHAMFRHYDRKTFMTFIHVWYGRLIFLLALVNGALGLKLGRSLRGGMEAATVTYSVIAAIIGTLYIAVLLFSAWKVNGKGEEKYVRRTDRRLGSMSRPRGEIHGFEDLPRVRR
jgi:Eukaryotic cytochrome b561